MLSSDAPMHSSSCQLAMRGITVVVLCTLLLAACSQGKDDQSHAERIVDAAMAAHPGDPEGGAQASLEAIQHEFKATMPENSQQRAAAIAFAGYYSKNVYAVADVCAANGIQLTNYTAALVELNAAAFKAAGRLVDVHEVMEAGKERDLMAARRELLQVAAHQKSDLRQVCSAIEQNSREVAPAATFSTALPDIHAILMDGARDISLERARER